MTIMLTRVFRFLEFMGDHMSSVAFLYHEGPSTLPFNTWDFGSDDCGEGPIGSV